MISFALSLVALILGYLLYGRFVERVIGLCWDVSSQVPPTTTSAACCLCEMVA